MSGLGFVLVHGGGLDARSWEWLTPRLDGPVLAMDLPGRNARPADLTRLSISDFVESAIADLDAFREADRVVLVGHSMAGLTIPGVAARRPDRIAHLVFLASSIPREGGSMEDEMPSLIRLAARLRPRPRAGAQPKPMGPRLARRMLCNGMDAEQTAFLTSRLVPEAPRLSAEQVSRDDLPSDEVIPRTYVKLLRDRAVPPKTQDRMIDNLGVCQVRTLNSGHAVMAGRPAQLATLLNEIRSYAA
ncbi:alpha/beta fold hydrolase [Streptomyces sp. NPDC096311]|uniref:alpha/beta fold hydrolase n=1 Tax=Streptomyces sp. NPDC096311 TaxID=3366083 RepID=UPI0037FF0E2C